MRNFLTRPMRVRADAGIIERILLRLYPLTAHHEDRRNRRLRHRDSLSIAAAGSALARPHATGDHAALAEFRRSARRRTARPQYASAEGDGHGTHRLRTMSRDPARTRRAARDR